MERKLLDIIVCPICKGRLLYDDHGQELICRFDKLAFPLHNRIPVMRIDQARELSETKRQIERSF